MLLITIALNQIFIHPSVPSSTVIQPFVYLAIHGILTAVPSVLSKDSINRQLWPVTSVQCPVSSVRCLLFHHLPSTVCYSLSAVHCPLVSPIEKLHLVLQSKWSAMNRLENRRGRAVLLRSCVTALNSKINLFNEMIFTHFLTF